MKKLLTILAALFVSANSVVQAQDCLWAQSAGGNYEDEGNSVCTDASGNVYVTGSFSSPTITFGTTILTNTGNTDIFIVKYSPNGDVLWAMAVGGSNDDEGKSVCTDADGNVYVAGFFSSAAITFGTTTLTDLGNSGYSDIFIAKYAPDGNVLWAKSAGGLNYDYDNVQSITTDIFGNVYLVGSFSSPITFGGTTLTSEGFNDIYLVKYDPNGAVLWAKSEGSNESTNGGGVSADANGNVYVAGYFSGKTLTIGETTLNNFGSMDIIIAKYNPNGTVLWAKSAGGIGLDFCESFSADANGNVYVTGIFQSPTISFGSTTLTNEIKGDNDIFIVKYNSDGNVLWANSAGSIGQNYGTGISADAIGNVYVTGYFSSSSITFDTTTLINVGNYLNIFIVKYNPSGTVLWAKSAGGYNGDYSSGVSADESGNVYVTGAYNSPTISFGTNTLSNANNLGHSPDIFIAKYSGISTGLNESLSNKQLNISPNPTNSTITLTMPSLKNSNVSITTLAGTEVGNYNTQNSNTQTIDISHLASGVYFVSLKSEEGVLTKKIIKQ